MIHEIAETLRELIAAARDLTSEWSWKRGSSRMHKDEYELLLKAIDKAQKLLERLESMNHKNEKDLENNG